MFSPHLFLCLPSLIPLVNNPLPVSPSSLLLPHPPIPPTGNKFSSCHAYLLIAAVWCYALIFAIGPLTGWGRYGSEPYGTACCIDWYAPGQSRVAMSYILCLFLFCYIVPCIIIFLSYIFILLTVKGSRQAVQQHISPQNKIPNTHTLIVKVRTVTHTLSRSGYTRSLSQTHTLISQVCTLTHTLSVKVRPGKANML